MPMTVAVVVYISPNCGRICVKANSRTSIDVQNGKSASSSSALPTFPATGT